MDFKKSLRFRMIITFIVIAFLVGGLFFLRADITARAEKIQKLESEIAIKQLNNQSLVLLRQDSQKAKTIENDIKVFLVSKDDLLAFPKEIAIQAKQLGINANITFKDEIAGTAEIPRSTSFVLSMNDAPGLDSLLAFMKSLDSGKYFVRINGLNVEFLNPQRLQGAAVAQVFSF